jgi:superfamily II DNA/RNA helicase
LKAEDVIACADTGTGKTRLSSCRSSSASSRAAAAAAAHAPLVLAPTRELAVQIEDQVRGLTYHTTISSIAVYGGVPMDTQERALKANVDIVVATPGRPDGHMRHDSPTSPGSRSWCLDEAGPHARHGLLARRSSASCAAARPSGRRCSSRRRCRAKC